MIIFFIFNFSKKFNMMLYNYDFRNFPCSIYPSFIFLFETKRFYIATTNYFPPSQAFSNFMTIFPGCSSFVDVGFPLANCCFYISNNLLLIWESPSTLSYKNFPILSPSDVLCLQTLHYQSFNPHAQLLNTPNDLSMTFKIVIMETLLFTT